MSLLTPRKSGRQEPRGRKRGRECRTHHRRTHTHTHTHTGHITAVHTHTHTHTHTHARTRQEPILTTPRGRAPFPAEELGEHDLSTPGVLGCFQLLASRCPDALSRWRFCIWVVFLGEAPRCGMTGSGATATFTASDPSCRRLCPRRQTLGQPLSRPLRVLPPPKRRPGPASAWLAGGKVPPCLCGFRGSCVVFLCFLVFLSFQGCTRSIWRFPGQGV